MSPKSVTGVIAGMLDAFVEENKLTEIEACYTNMHWLDPAFIHQAIEDAKAGNWVDVGMQLMQLAQFFPQEFKACEGMGSDIQDVEAWAQIFKDKTKLEETIAKNLLLHEGEITADFDKFKTDYEAAKYFDSGKAAGDALILALGPVSTGFKYGMFL